MNNKNKKPLLPQQSLKDRQRKFAELLRAKQAETKARAAREQQERERIGYKMPDGTIYAGVSPYTGNPMYTTPGDAPLTMAFDDAALYGARLDANGHKDWRLPTKNELEILFNNRAVIGGLDRSGSWPSSWYWSSSLTDPFSAWAQRFSDGFKNYYPKTIRLSVRFVR